MSTRATYHFKASEFSPSVTFYIHHDGYPAGAAHYAALMLAHDCERPGWAVQFIRANDAAEFTRSHDFHGDTEYRYDFDEKKQTVTAYERSSGWDDDEPKFSIMGTWDVAAFVAKFAEWEQTPKDFVKLNGRTVSSKKAAAWIDSAFANSQNAYWQGWIGNASCALSAIENNVELLSPHQRKTLQSMREAISQRFAA